MILLAIVSQRESKRASCLPSPPTVLYPLIIQARRLMYEMWLLSPSRVSSGSSPHSEASYRRSSGDMVILIRLSIFSAASSRVSG